MARSSVERRLVVSVLPLGLLAVAPVFFACSDFGSASESAPPTEAGTSDGSITSPSDDDDGGASDHDAGDDADATVEDAAGDPGNVLGNAGFDQDCSGWVTANAVMTHTSSGRDGGACKVCASGGGPARIVHSTTGSLTSSKYRFEAWIAAVPGTERPTGISMKLSPMTDDGMKLSPPPTSHPAPEDAWALIGDTVTLEKTTHRRLEIELAAKDAQGCFVVDDVSLRAE